MKRIKKILIILSLSLYLTAIITPQKEKEVNAFAITGAFIFGSLAITAMGGLVAYHNRDYIAKLGADVSQKLQDDGVDVASMFESNRFGINQNVVRKMAESIEESKGRVDTSSYAGETFVLGTGSYIGFDIPEDEFARLSNASRIYMVINHVTTDGTPFDIGELRVAGKTTHYYYTRLSAISSHPSQSTPTSSVISFAGTVLNHVKESGKIHFHNATNSEARIKYYMYTDSQIGYDIQGQSGINSYDNTAGYANAITNVYNNSTVSVDYNKLADIMSNAQSEPISLTNIESLVSGIQDSIEEGTESQVGILTTIWNGIKNIPNIMQQTTTSVIGAINGIPEALSGLWDDLGTIWTGFGETLSNVGTDIKEMALNIPNAISNGIDNIRDFNADMLERLSIGIDNIKVTGTNIITTITDTAIGIGDRIGAIGSDIITGITSIVVPSQSDMDKVGEKADRLRDSFSSKLDFITVPIKSISGLFAQPKSLYDVTFTMQGVKVHVLPESFKSSVNVLKPVLNGVLVLLTFFGIYKKIQGKEVV